MADTKFSDLAAATEVNNADIVCIAQPGIDSLKATVSQILQAPFSESRSLAGGDGSSVTVGGGGGHTSVLSGSAGQLKVRNTAIAEGITIYAGGAMDISTPSGVAFQIYSGSGSISINTSGIVVIGSGGNQSVVYYLPTNPGDWSFFTLPLEMAKALDALARVVSNSGANPIPY